jgi:hypothetical protein
MIAIPIPAGIVWERDRLTLERVIEAMFMVTDVHTVEVIDPRLPLPGIRITGQSWDQYQRIAEKILVAGAL